MENDVAEAISFTDVGKQNDDGGHRQNWIHLGAYITPAH